MKPENKYDVAKQFSAGYAACLTPLPRSLLESDHWIAGWDAGYSARRVKNDKLNEYLVSVGHEPMLEVRLAKQE